MRPCVTDTGVEETSGSSISEEGISSSHQQHHMRTADILLAATLICCVGGCTWWTASKENKSKEKKAAQVRSAYLKDSTDKKELTDFLEHMYPDAWVWDSLDFEYSYAYQTSLKERSSIALTEFEVLDIYQTDSTLHTVLRVSDRLHLRTAALFNLNFSEARTDLVKGFEYYLDMPRMDWWRKGSLKQLQVFGVVARISSVRRIIDSKQYTGDASGDEADYAISLTSDCPLSFEGELLAVFPLLE